MKSKRPAKKSRFFCFYEFFIILQSDKRHLLTKNTIMELHNEAIQRRITEINRYISDLIKVKKNIEKTEVKIELHSAFEETIAIDFTNPFFCADLKHRFVEQFIEKAIDYYLKEYQHLTSINK